MELTVGAVLIITVYDPLNMYISCAYRPTTIFFFRQGASLGKNHYIIISILILIIILIVLFLFIVVIIIIFIVVVVIVTINIIFINILNIL